jgi:hypothetical protein
MLGLQFIPIVLAALLIGAHFLRSGNLISLLISLVLPLFLAVRRPWAATILRIGLVIAALQWAYTAFARIQARHEMGEPFLRLGFILGGVAVATALCLLVFRYRRVREHFHLG